MSKEDNKKIKDWVKLTNWIKQTNKLQFERLFKELRNINKGNITINKEKQKEYLEAQIIALEFNIGSYGSSYIEALYFNTDKEKKAYLKYVKEILKGCKHRKNYCRYKLKELDNWEKLTEQNIEGSYPNFKIHKLEKELREIEKIIIPLASLKDIKEFHKELYEKGYIDKESLNIISEHYSNKFEIYDILNKINWKGKLIDLIALFEYFEYFELSELQFKDITIAKHYLWKGKEITPKQLRRNRNNYNFINNSKFDPIKDIINKYFSKEG